MEENNKQETPEITDIMDMYRTCKAETDKVRDDYKQLYYDVHEFVHHIEKRRERLKFHQKVISYFENVFCAVFSPKDIVNEFDVLLTANEILYNAYKKKQK